jgi:hypothetical protein
MLSDKELCDRVLVEGKARCHWSATLKQDYEAYVKLIRRLLEIGILRFDFGGACHVGIFVVAKKSGKQRVIVDCRMLNQRLRAPLGPHSFLRLLSLQSLLSQMWS